MCVKWVATETDICYQSQDGLETRRKKRDGGGSGRREGETTQAALKLATRGVSLGVVYLNQDEMSQNQLQSTRTLI